MAAGTLASRTRFNEVRTSADNAFVVQDLFIRRPRVLSRCRRGRAKQK